MDIHTLYHHTHGTLSHLISSLFTNTHTNTHTNTNTHFNAQIDANNVDLSQFERWYNQAGTPIVEAKEVRTDLFLFDYFVYNPHS
jgi:aminopeptidase N